MGAQLVDSICATLEDYGDDLSRLRASIYPRAIRQLTDYLALQYLAALTEKYALHEFALVDHLMCKEMFTVRLISSTTYECYRNCHFVYTLLNI